MDETHNPFLAEEGDPLLKKREEAMQASRAALLWGLCWALVSMLLLKKREEFMQARGVASSVGFVLGVGVNVTAEEAGGGHAGKSFDCGLGPVCMGGLCKASPQSSVGLSFSICLGSLPPLCPRAPCLSWPCTACDALPPTCPLQKRMTRRDGTVMSLAQSKRASELQRDMNAWEENRMMTSGVVRLREVGSERVLSCLCF